VDGDEGVAMAFLIDRVDCAREDLFAGSCFALEQDGDVADLRGLVRALQHGIHARARRHESEP
jgi:hypothetical protein